MVVHKVRAARIVVVRRTKPPIDHVRFTTTPLCFSFIFKALLVRRLRFLIQHAKDTLRADYWITIAVAGRTPMIEALTLL